MLGPKASHSNEQQKNVKNRKKPCIFCKHHHAAAVCDVVCDTEKRYELVKTQNLCFNCLAPHKVSQCSSKHHCKLCNKNIAPACAEMVQQLVVKWWRPKRLPHQPKHMLALLLQHQALVLLSAYWRTAVAPISGGNYKTTANILFDEGAQRSFISADMASELGITPDNTEQVAVATFESQTMSHQKMGVATIMVET